MGWLDGMTNCPGECNIDSSSVSFSNFALKDGKKGLTLFEYYINFLADAPTTTTTTTTTTTQKTTTTEKTTQTTEKTTPTTQTTTTHKSTANPNCPGGDLAGCMALCPEDDPVMFQNCVKECISACS